MGVKPELTFTRWYVGVATVVLLIGQAFRPDWHLDVIAGVLIVAWLVCEAVDTVEAWWKRRVAGWKREGIYGPVRRASRFWHEVRRAWRDGSQ